MHAQVRAVGELIQPSGTKAAECVHAQVRQVVGIAKQHGRQAGGRKPDVSREVEPLSQLDQGRDSNSQDHSLPCLERAKALDQEVDEGAGQQVAEGSTDNPYPRAEGGHAASEQEERGHAKKTYSPEAHG